jgi:hypothetical protein
MFLCLVQHGCDCVCSKRCVVVRHAARRLRQGLLSKLQGLLGHSQ